MMKDYCLQRNLPINNCGKLVVAQNEQELTILEELAERGKINGCNVKLITIEQAEKIDPNVKSYRKVLYSPDTVTINPTQICKYIRDELIDQGVLISFYTQYVRRVYTNHIETTKGDFTSPKIINCAGVYADQIAHEYGMGRNYQILPFKGLYLKYTKNMTDVLTNIYPVPNLNNPFLGVHFTKTITGDIKIGPTAIPAFWRENYTIDANFKLNEFKEIMALESQLFFKNSFHFRKLTFEEIRKYRKRYFIKLASKLVKNIDPDGFTEFTPPGIRAQLVDLRNNSLVQDFVVEEDRHSLHILNAVSPAFTCAFSFAQFLKNKYNLS